MKRQRSRFKLLIFSSSQISSKIMISTISSDDEEIDRLFQAIDGDGSSSSSNSSHSHKKKKKKDKKTSKKACTSMCVCMCVLRAN